MFHTAGTRRSSLVIGSRRPVEGLKRTKSPAAVAKFLDFLSQDAHYSEMMARTENIPAHLGVAKAGVTYNVSPLAKAALNSFVGDVAKILKPNFDLQG